MSKRFLFISAAFAVLTRALVVASAPAAGSTAFPVKSTLDGRSVLPSRLHWLVDPKLSPATRSAPASPTRSASTATSSTSRHRSGWHR
jgi:hypothetical protein